MLPKEDGSLYRQQDEREVTVWTCWRTVSGEELWRFGSLLGCSGLLLVGAASIYYCVYNLHVAIRQPNQLKMGCRSSQFQRTRSAVTRVTKSMKQLSNNHQQWP